MSYREWRKWLKSMPWNFKWFIYLILFRPLIDNFFFLKETSPLLSPLYIVGVLTPILITHTLYTKKMPVKSNLDRLFGYWLLIVLINSFIMLLTDITDIETIAAFLKVSLPFFLYYYLRRLLKSEKDLDGILTTTIYSGIFIYTVFLYEVLVHPIEIQETRSGVERIQGFYADVANYGMYTMLIFISLCYFFLKKPTTFKRIRNLIIYILLFILVLVRINHIASYMVFGTILILFFYFNFTLKPTYAIIFALLFGLFLSFYLTQIREESFDPLTARELEVARGEREEEQGLHGRVGRWKWIFQRWGKLPIYDKIFGVPYSFDHNWNGSYQVYPHNDFVRLLMLTGWVGLSSYILIIINVFIKVFKQRKFDRFLGLATLMMLILYSISLVPTFYAYVMYFVMSIFAFIAIPKKIVVKNVEE